MEEFKQRQEIEAKLSDQINARKGSEQQQALAANDYASLTEEEKPVNYKVPDNISTSKSVIAKTTKHKDLAHPYARKPVPQTYTNKKKITRTSTLQSLLKS